MAFKRLFDDKFIGDKQQRTNYHKWSERAIIVGYNGDTQTYDVVITTERLAGVSKRTLNKTIRNVKSTIPPSSLTFSPGDSVLVGYVSEKREHPVIIGGGGNVVQDAAVVTIGIATSEVEGGGAEITPVADNPGFIDLNCTGELVDSLTGSTTTLTVDCDDLDITGCFRANVEAPSDCGCGVYEWTLNGAGFTISDEGLLASAVGITITLAPFGPGNSQLKICPPTTNPSVPGLAVHRQGCCSINCGHAGGNLHPSSRCSALYGCDGAFISCSGSHFNQSIGVDIFTDQSCACSSHLGHPISGPGGTFPCSEITCAGDCPGLSECDCLQLKGIVVDSRSASMVAQGCFPCFLAMDGTSITATDACGVLRTLEVVVE